MGAEVVPGRVDCTECRRHVLYPDGKCSCVAEAEQHDFACETVQWELWPKLSARKEVTPPMSADECECFERKAVEETP